jgi:hypothetical protein
MADTFYLLDLRSQAPTVRRLLCGRPEQEKLLWLGARGRLVLIETRVPNAQPVYQFQSVLELECLFFIDGDRFVFIGDHTSYAVGD